MNMGEKLVAIINSEYLRFIQNMNRCNLDSSLSLIVLENMKSKLLEQIYQESLENKVKEELTHEDK